MQVFRPAVEDRDGVTQDIGADDILVVTPYNMQVNFEVRITGRLPSGYVDKFQGQQAAAVLVSMTTSTAEESRGVGVSV